MNESMALVESSAIEILKEEGYPQTMFLNDIQRATGINKKELYRLSKIKKLQFPMFKVGVKWAADRRDIAHYMDTRRKQSA